LDGIGHLLPLILVLRPIFSDQPVLICLVADEPMVIRAMYPSLRARRSNPGFAAMDCFVGSLLATTSQ
jgi:hypothetical protein